MASVVTIGLNQFIERGPIPADEWDKYKREAMQEQHQEVMRANPNADEDPQVAWNFRKDWRTAPLPPTQVFGSDYDYWSYAVNDALDLWKRYAPAMPQIDYIAERIANDPSGWTRGVYAGGFGVWQDGVKTTFGARLEGPRVDVGPTADFAAFLENWDYGRKFSAGPVMLFRHIGVLNTIAHELAVAYLGVHTITMMPIRATSPDTIKTKNRTKPVYTFPIIRIAPRHYRKRK